MTITYVFLFVFSVSYFYFYKNRANGIFISLSEIPKSRQFQSNIPNTIVRKGSNTVTDRKVESRIPAVFKAKYRLPGRKTPQSRNTEITYDPH